MRLIKNRSTDTQTYKLTHRQTDMWLTHRPTDGHKKEKNKMHQGGELLRFPKIRVREGVDFRSLSYNN